VAIKSARPDVEVIGVQVEACAPFVASLEAGAPVPVNSALTIADGIAVKRPGDLTLALIREWVDEMLLVGEDEVSEAMVFLLERTKLVVEGAGAVGVAAVLSGRLAARPSAGTTVLVLSGGNVGVGLLSEVALRHENQAGRRIVLLARMSDLPGSLATLLTLVAAEGGNLVEVQHIREGVDLHVRETGVQLILETRGEEHARQITQAVRDAGYSELRLLG
jgi:threonine dehydratase